jgi:hypothetical protein
MLNKLLHRSIGAVNRRLILLAPPQASVPYSFENVDADPERYQSLLTDMQRLRGSIYLRDGAVESNQLSPDGLHRTPEDERSWHLLMVDKAGQVNACVWYMEHAPTVSVNQLRVRKSPLASLPEWRDRLWSAVEMDLSKARQAGLGFAEVGGWAVAEDSRCGSEGLVLALAGYSLGRVLGGAIGMTTATVRHCSSTILRRLGGTDLTVGDQKIPSYYDPRYKCEMELLRFDSRHPSLKYNGLVELLKEKLGEVVVIAPHLESRSSVEFFSPGTSLPQWIPATT